MERDRQFLSIGRSEYVIIGLAVLPIIFAVSAWLRPAVAVCLDDWTQALTGYFSMILSVGLLYLYYQQKEVLERQSEPLISAEELKPTNGDGDLDYFQARLSNIGGGPVTHLSLKIEPEVVSRGTVRSSFPLVEEEAEEFVQSEFLYPHSSTLDRAQSAREDVIMFNSRLESGETGVFNTPATLYFQHPIMDPGEGKENATNYAWESAIDSLESLGVEDLRLRILIQYEGVDEDNEELVSDYVIPIDTDSSLVDVFALGEPMYRYELGPDTLYSKLE